MNLCLAKIGIMSAVIKNSPSLNFSNYLTIIDCLNQPYFHEYFSWFFFQYCQHGKHELCSMWQLYQNFRLQNYYFNYPSALFSRFFLLLIFFFFFFSVLSTWKAWVVLDVTMALNRKRKLSTPTGNCTIQNVLCKY